MASVDENEAPAEKPAKKSKELTEAQIDEQRLCMLLLHNSKIQKVMDKYKVEMEKKAEARK